jgi:hypothetical protein
MPNIDGWRILLEDAKEAGPVKAVPVERVTPAHFRLLLYAHSDLGELLDEVDRWKNRVKEALRDCEAVARIHSQYPIGDSFDKGYDKARKDAGNEIQRRGEELWKLWENEDSKA